MGKFGNISKISENLEPQGYRSLSDISGEQEQELLQSSLDSKVKELIATYNEISRLLLLKKNYIDEINKIKRKLGGK